jgi:hypothetical protein
VDNEDKEGRDNQQPAVKRVGGKQKREGKHFSLKLLLFILDLEF